MFLPFVKKKSFGKGDLGVKVPLWKGDLGGCFSQPLIPKFKPDTPVGFLSCEKIIFALWKRLY
jgi:hypothetical protein